MDARTPEERAVGEMLDLYVEAYHRATCEWPSLDDVKEVVAYSLRVISRLKAWERNAAPGPADPPPDDEEECLRLVLASGYGGG